MPVEEDGDEILTPIEAGCLSCVVWDGDTPTHPKFIVSERVGRLFYECPKCKGSFGSVPMRKGA